MLKDFSCLRNMEQKASLASRLIYDTFRVNQVRRSLFWSSLLLALMASLFMANMNIVPSTVAQPVHDIAVTSVTTPTTSTIASEPVNITVVVENQGTTAENFTVAVYHATTLVENKTLTDLVAGSNITLFFIWNTADVKTEVDATSEKEKSYTIEARASIVPGETDTQDNTLTSLTTVMVKTHYIAIIPQRTVNFTITSGITYTVAIRTDYSGSDVWSWQFSLTYNKILLEGIEVRNGDLITNTTANGDSARFIAGAFNNSIGKLSLTVAYFSYLSPPPPTTSGPGTLAYVTFRVKRLGESNITLGETDTKLLGYNLAEGGDYSIIDDIFPSLNHMVGGYFRNTAALIVHDIAVVSITPSSTSKTVGDTIDITVVVENNGTVDEGFDVVAYYDYDDRFQGQNVIATETVSSLAADANTTLTFTWNTTNVKADEHKLTAVVPNLPGELNTANNKLDSETVTINPKESRPLPITEILVVLVVVVAIIAAIVIIRRRRKKPLPEET